MKKIFFAFCLITSFVFSQQKTTLKKILNNLSVNYKIAFSYNENAILVYDNINQIKSNSLQEILNNLSIKTTLVFEKVDSKNYIIRKPSKDKVSICGVVLSNVDKAPIAYVNISFDDRNLYANQKGNFVIDKALKDGFITVSALGYKSKKVLVNSFTKECKTIYLEESVNTLPEIIITDYLTRGFSKKKDGSIELTPKNMGVLPGVLEPDVLQTLQLIPGVQSPDETASGIHVRGGTPDQNLVIIDGIKMYHFAHFFGLISAFNPYITSDVKLYRSGTHAKYGNNTGGVLDIKTDKNIPKKLTAGFGTTFTHSDFYLKTPLFNKKVGVILSARRSITDLVNSITYKQYSEIVFQNNKIADAIREGDDSKVVDANNDFFYEDYYAKIIIKLSNKSKFSINTIYNANDLFFSGKTPNPLNQRIFKDVLVTKSKGIGADWTFGDLVSGLNKLSVYRTEYDKKYQGRTILEAENALGSTDRRNTLIENSFSYLFEKLTSKSNLWQLGYQFNNFDVFYDFTRDLIDPNKKDALSSPIGGKTYNHALFAEYKIKHKKWLANLGMRWQFFRNINKGYFEPRLNVTYKLNSFLALRGSTELKHQSVSQIEEFRQGVVRGLFDRFWTISQKDKYSVLKSLQNSFGVNYQRKGWTLDAEVYAKYIDGIQFLFEENIEGQKNFSGSNTALGLDILLKKQWKNYGTWVTYSLSDSKYLFSEFNNGKKFDGSFDMPHNLIWSHNYTYKNFETSLGWRFRSGIPYTLKTTQPSTRFENTLEVAINDLNTKRLPNYQRLDFSASYKFIISNKNNVKGKLGLTLQNILNKRNILFRDFQLANQTIIEGPNRVNIEVLEQLDTYSMGFVPNMVFRVSF